MNLAHPLRVTLGQVIINRNDMDSLAFQRVQVCRKCGNKRLTFTCFHLGNTPLMKDNTTDDLYTVMLHSKNTFCSFTNRCKCFRNQRI